MKKIIKTLMLFVAVTLATTAHAQEQQKTKVIVDEKVENVDGVMMVKLKVTKIEDGEVTVYDTMFKADEKYDTQQILSGWGINKPSDSLNKKMVVVKEINDGDKKILIKTDEEDIDVSQDGEDIVIMKWNDSANGKKIIIRENMLMELDSTVDVDVIMRANGKDSFINVEKQFIMVIKVGVEELTEDERMELIENKVFNKKASPIEDVEVKAYPNPSSGTLRIEFNLETEGNTTVKIHDVTGKEVFLEELKDFSGLYLKEISLAGSESGIYFLTVIQGNKVLTKKIVLQ